MVAMIADDEFARSGLSNEMNFDHISAISGPLCRGGLLPAGMTVFTLDFMDYSRSYK